MKGILIQTLLSVLLIIMFFSCSLNENIISRRHSVNKEADINGHKMKVGLWIENVDSNAIQIVSYKNGLKQGKFKTVYPGGAYAIGEYKDDLKNGPVKYYGTDGLFYMQEVYKADKKVQTNMYSPHF